MKKMFTVSVCALVLAVAVTTTTTFAGGEIHGRKAYVPAPIPALTAAPVVVERSGFFSTVVGYFTNVVCDVGDVVYQSADAVTGVIGIDLANDNAVP